MTDHSITIHRTRTGAQLDVLDNPSWSFTEALAWGDRGKGSVKMPLPGADDSGRLTRDALRSIASAMSGVTICVSRGRAALWAGVVATLGWSTTEVTLGLAAPSWILDRRMVMAPGTLADPANITSDLVLTLQARDRALALLLNALTGTGRDFPLIVPAPSAASGPTVTYAAMDLRSTYESVKEIVEADGGPDLLITPQLDQDGTLSWAVAAGNPYLGGPNPDAVWDYPLASLAGSIDDSETVSTSYVPGEAVGEGDQETRLVGVASRDRGPLLPALERVDRTSTSQTRKDILDALAASHGDTYQYAVEELTVAVPSDEGPQYREQWGLGDAARFAVSGHPWLDTQDTHTRRVVAADVDAMATKMTTIGPRLTVGGV